MSNKPNKIPLLIDLNNNVMDDHEMTELDMEVARQLVHLSEGETTTTATTTTTTTTTSSCDSCNSNVYNLLHSSVAVNDTSRIVSKNDNNNNYNKNIDNNNGGNRVDDDCEIAGELEDDDDDDNYDGDVRNRRYKIRKYRAIAELCRVTERID